VVEECFISKSFADPIREIAIRSSFHFKALLTDFLIIFSLDRALKIEGLDSALVFGSSLRKLFASSSIDRILF